MRARLASGILVGLIFFTIGVIMAFDVNDMQRRFVRFEDLAYLQVVKIGILLLAGTLGVLAFLVISGLPSGTGELDLMTPGGRLILGFVSLVAFGLAVWKEMELLAIAGLVFLTLSVLPMALRNLMDRLRRAGPFEFDTPVDEALKAVTDNAVRSKAKQQAREIDARLQQAMGNWSRFMNVLRAEVAALGVRITATEEELISLLAKLRSKGII